MIRFNSNLNNKNVNISSPQNTDSKSGFAYLKNQSVVKDSVEFSSRQVKKENFLSRLFGSKKSQMINKSNQELHYNLKQDFGKAQKLKAKEIGESQAELAIKKAFAENRDNLNYQILAEDEYNRIRQVGKYQVDYGAEGLSSNEEYLLASIAGADPGEEFYNTKTYTLDGKNIAQVKVFPLKHWAWRNGTGSNISNRVSLNVKPEGDFINELDIFMKTGIYTDLNGKQQKVEEVTNFFYKTPLNLESWNKRQDPVTVYFRTNVNDETYKAITDISSRYARGYVNNSNENTPWISNIEKEPDETMVNSLIQELGKYSKNASSSLKSLYKLQAQAISSGQYNAYINLLRYMKEAIQN